MMIAHPLPANPAAARFRERMTTWAHQQAVPHPALLLGSYGLDR